MALIDTDLVTRYYIDEAASGTTPTQLLDASGNNYDLDTTYDAPSMAYTEDSGNRGVELTNSDGDARSYVDIATSDAVETALDGSTKVTLEVVADITEGSASTGRLFAINFSSSNPELGFCVVGTDVRIYWGGSVLRSWTRVTGRKVYHVVIDTTQGTPADRVKIYVDGQVDAGVDEDSNPSQNDTLSFDNTYEYLLFNRGVDSWGRSMEGTVYYFASYAGAFSAQDCSDNYDVLIVDDDTPGGGTTYNETASDSYDFADAISESAMFAIAESDSYDFSDAVSGSAVFYAAVGDSYDFADGAVATLVGAVSLEDSYDFADAVAPKLLGLESLSDSYDFSDSISATMVALESLSDSYVFSDAVTSFAGNVFSYELSDSYDFADGVAPVTVLNVAVSDSYDFSDAVDTISTYVLSLVDSYDFGDVAIQRGKGIDGYGWATFEYKGSKLVVNVRSAYIVASAKAQYIVASVKTQ